MNITVPNARYETNTVVEVREQCPYKRDGSQRYK